MGLKKACSQQQDWQLEPMALPTLRVLERTSSFELLLAIITARAE